MSRSRTIGAAVVVGALIVAVLVVLLAVFLTDAGDVERRTTRDQRETPRTGAVFELAASADPAHNGAGFDRERTVVVADDVPTAADALLLPCRVRVLERGEPVEGAAVELWRYDGGECIALVSDANGIAPFDEELLERGSWQVLAGWDGRCNVDLLPVTVGGSNRSVDVHVAHSSHLAFVLERSDGAPIGRFPWVGVQRAGVRTGIPADEWGFVLLDGESEHEELSNRALVLAGLDPRHAVGEQYVIQSRTGVVVNADLVGSWREPDTKRAEVETPFVPVASGGGVARVVLEVEADVAFGVLEVNLVGAPVDDPVEGLRLVRVELCDTAGVKEWEFRLTRSRGALFEVPAGVVRARLTWTHWMVAGESVDAPRHGTPLVEIVVPANGSGRLDFDLSGFGAVRVEGLRSSGPTSGRMTFVDIANPEPSHVDCDADGHAVVLVRPGQHLVSIKTREGDRLCTSMPIDVAWIAEHPRVGRGKGDLTDRVRAAVRTDHRSESIDVALEPFLVRVEAGAVTVVRPVEP